MNIIKQNWKVIVLTFATLLLGTLGIITALKLYQTRKQPIAPTAPKKAPAVSESCVLAFNLATVLPTPSPIPTVTIKPTPTLNLTPTPTRLTPTPTQQTPTPTKTTPTPTQTTPTPTATATLKPTTTLNPTLTASPTKKPTPTDRLPVSGISLPLITAIAAGILILGLALLIAF